MAFIAKCDFRAVSVIVRPPSVGHSLPDDSSFGDGGDSLVAGHSGDVLLHWYPPPPFQ